MMGFEVGKTRVCAALLGVSLLAACATKAPPPPPPPPPPPVEVIPIRPLPPSGAIYSMGIPPRGLDGQHQTLLRGLSDDQRTWYFRSAWNVAALNCVGPQYQPVLDGYRAFLTDNAKTLKAVNLRLDKTFQKEYPGAPRQAIMAREKLMTMVYNFFALPPARAEFCQAGMRMASLVLATPKPDAASLAAANFAAFEAPFENFFTAYEQYQRDSAAWDARYGARYGASQPGYVAVQAARARSILQVGTNNPASLTSQPVTQTGVVIDLETGAKIPIVAVTPQSMSVPVVQPIARETPKPIPASKP